MFSLCLSVLAFCMLSPWCTGDKILSHGPSHLFLILTRIIVVAFSMADLMIISGRDLVCESGEVSSSLSTGG